ncbi:MAG: DUF4280 domain-containing protein, partial [Holosporales bacterium]|nr:DUF4280 domain-containing protein [Holosporales bacterium]
MAIAVNGAICQCSFGTNPSNLQVIPKIPVDASGLPVATIMDFIPILNILSFGMCTTVSNPAVAAATAAATAAALGVFTLTPMACIPAVASPWIPTTPTIILPTGP